MYGAKVVAAVLTAVSMLTMFTGMAMNLPDDHTNHDVSTMGAEQGGAVAGRIVAVPVKVYKQAFKDTLKLGQCPLVMEEGKIKTCSDEFEGEQVHLPKASTTVDVGRVQTSEDILTHIMGGVGASIGVLGIISVNPKVTVAVTTDTNRKSLNLISSYEVNKGVIALHHAKPKRITGERPIFLSEIELGGNELFLVTLGFESEKQKTDVEVTVTFKILFISITARLKYVKNTFSSKVSCRIQFKSSWRKELDEYFSSLDNCIPRVEELEKMYMNGPSEMRDMSVDDERSHYFYYFSSWKESPYGSQFNLALINHDLDFLTQQNTEIKATIKRINSLKDQTLPEEVKAVVIQLNQTLTEKSQNLTVGLNNYHTLSPEGRQELREIYGENKAPLYYQRWLSKIVG